MGGSGKNIKGEFSQNGVPNPGKHDAAGVLAMARSTDKDSASSQFYFTLASAPHLDGGYAVSAKSSRASTLFWPYARATR